MKLFILKLVSAVVVLGSALLCWLLVKQPEAFVPLGTVLRESYLPETLLMLNLKYTGMTISAAVLLLACYALLPVMRGKRSITFDEDLGTTTIDLDSNEKILNQVMRKMEEVKSIKIRVNLDKSGEKAVISATGILMNQPNMSARETSSLVKSYIARTAVDMLGMDSDTKVNFRLRGVDMDAQVFSELLRNDYGTKPLSQGTTTNVAPLISDSASSSEDSGTEEVRMDAVEDEAPAYDSFLQTSSTAHGADAAEPVVDADEDVLPMAMAVPEPEQIDTSFDSEDESAYTGVVETMESDTVEATDEEDVASENVSNDQDDAPVAENAADDVAPAEEPEEKDKWAF
jgi:hypothetical protein